MNITRLLRHLATTSIGTHRAFPASALRSIEQAIAASEASHAGELRFVVEGALDTLPLLRGQTAPQRAIELFAQLHVWDTACNTGVLIYVLLADHRVEIVADRGIHAKAGAEAWSAICRGMESQFSAGEFGSGAVHGIKAVTSLLTRHFPLQPGDRNELPDAPLVL
ncbi:TPM domain-containing protein [Piscinibacter gummiphilus]|uniref:TPM domain-containing protein n=1 Tax=Piscinibacter gummiphilus TaxID=946333 RepID=A0ABZ0D144_9BURK|nr:TPM domain-containing protein [Piscinibacter gummiphilus]WOB10909.1 TPM domain-containing protein [Piscinibacter gummiphilus]